MTKMILHETILCIGHLCSLNQTNQNSLLGSTSPHLLIRLISLPIQYFSQKPLTDILYPTLIACCYKNPNNTELLGKELNLNLLANYIEVNNFLICDLNLNQSRIFSFVIFNLFVSILSILVPFLIHRR